MAKYRRLKALWHKMKFKFKLTLTNENTLADVVNVHVSRIHGIAVLTTVIIILFCIAAAIITFTPLRNYLPGYMNSEVRSQIVNNALKVDSLQQMVNKQTMYIMNIQDIFSGKIMVDTVQTIETLTEIREDSLMARTRQEDEFRRKYEEAEKYNLSSIDPEIADLMGIIFYRPTRGMISSRFDADHRHFGIDIAANPNESVLATLEGTVLLSTYTAETGYLISVQHPQGFVSVYKHCDSLLKREGERVRAGEAIALVGNTGELTTGPHLHFELWHKGRPLNPENYIVF